ncbi:MAG: domain S-box protein, partial [Mucilaginibacter sp.]|nr:domain S-box protein [Mucilaginibacter sp.]
MENASLLNAIIQNAIDGIITIDERGLIETINPAACKLFDYTPQEVIGKNVSFLMPPPHRSQHDEYIRR